MANRDYIPDREAELVPWGVNLVAGVANMYASIGLTIDDATELGTQFGDFKDAWQIARDPATRGEATIFTKDQLKRTFIQTTRRLMRIVQSFPGTSDEARRNLGITIPKHRTVVPVPTAMPNLDVLSVVGRSVRLKVHDGSDLRAKPADVAEARLFTFVGDHAPEDEAQWRFVGATTRTTKTLNAADAVAGKLLWLRACWVNAKAQAGPMSVPISTAVQLATPPAARAAAAAQAAKTELRKAA